MSHDQRFLNEDHKLFATFGFTRKHCPRWIPIPITHLIFHFYDELYTIRLSGTERDNFMLSAEDQLSFHFELKYNQQISFSIRIFPNCNNGFTIASIHAFYQSNQVIDLSSTVIMTIEEADIRYETLISGTNEASWPPYSVPRSDLKQYPSLTFGFLIDIDWVKCADHSVEGIRWVPFQMDKQMVLTNHFHSESRMGFQSNTIGYTFHHDDLWQILLFPKGFETEDETQSDLYLKLLRWPYDLDSIEVSVKVIVGSFESAVQVFRYNISLQRDKPGAVLDAIMSNEMFYSQIDWLTLTLFICVTNVHRSDGKVVDIENIDVITENM